MSRLLAILLFLFVLVACTFAQFETATIVGTIRDQSGAVVNGASVRVKNLQTGISQTLATNSEGEFEAASLRIGSYEVQATKDGFAPAIASNVALTVSARQRVDLVLKVGSGSDVVEVSAAAPILDTDSSERGQVVIEKQITQLPLNGREYSQLVLLTSGTRQSAIGTGSVSTNREGSFNVNGLRSTYNNYLLDGLEKFDWVSKAPIHRRHELDSLCAAARSALCKLPSPGEPACDQEQSDADSKKHGNLRRKM